MSKYDQAIAAIRSPLPAEPGLRDFVRFATLAPNSHKPQPWTFRLEENAVEIRPDFSRRCPVVDPDDHHLYVTLGCAAENLAIAANAGGLPANVTVQANGPRGFSVRVSLGHGVRSHETLCAAIPKRQSTKSEYDGTPLSASESEALGSAAAGYRVLTLSSFPTDRNWKSRFYSSSKAIARRSMTVPLSANSVTGFGSIRRLHLSKSGAQARKLSVSLFLSTLICLAIIPL